MSKTVDLNSVDLKHERPIFLPGDRLITLDLKNKSDRWILGPGLRRDESSNEANIAVTQPGFLRFREPNILWIDTNSQRYVPVQGDQVVGVVTQKMADSWKLDIGSADLATISYLAFEGATKRNRPNVQVGDLLYCRIVTAIKHMEPELVCIDSQGRARGMGVLGTDGFMFNVPLHVARRLLDHESELLKMLGKQISFEITCGMNGRVWVRSRSGAETIALMHAIQYSEYLSKDQIPEMVQQVVDSVKGFN